MLNEKHPPGDLDGGTGSSPPRQAPISTLGKSVLNGLAKLRRQHELNGRFDRVAHLDRIIEELSARHFGRIDKNYGNLKGHGDMAEIQRLRIRKDPSAEASHKWQCCLCQDTVFDSRMACAPEAIVEDVAQDGSVYPADDERACYENFVGAVCPKCVNAGPRVGERIHFTADRLRREADRLDRLAAMPLKPMSAEFGTTEVPGTGI